MNPIISGWQNLFESGDDRRQLARLGAILEMSPGEAQDIIHNRTLGYRCYRMKKRHSGFRQIAAPNGRLKRLQRKLCKNYLNNLPVHYCSTAFQKRRSIKDHARMHVGQELVLSCDIKDFFESTSRKRLKKFFGDLGWQGKPLLALLKLTSFRGGLPQGAPTSPVLSNVLNYEMDQRLNEHANFHRARFSRYCDDIAFSWAVSEEPAAFRTGAQGVLERFDYHLQSNKGWRLQLRKDIPELTGVAIKGYQLVPSKELHLKRAQLKKKARRSAGAFRQWIGLKGFWKFLKS